MSNEATIINNPDSTPSAVSTGYQLQNTGFIAQRNGVDNTIITVNGTSQIDVEISGPVDVNGVLYSITTQATLTLTVTGRYCVYLNGSGNYLTPTLVLLSSTAFDDSKNARYYSGYRVLNWIINFNSVTPETIVSKLLNPKRNGSYVNDLIVDNSLNVENDLIVSDNTTIGGNLSVSGVATLPTISGGNLTLSGNAVLPTIAGNSNITGDLTMSSGKDVKISGAGRVEHGGTPVAGYLSDGTPFYKKYIQIGDWNMDSTAYVNVAHGLTLANIRNIKIEIYNDSGEIRDLNGGAGLAVAGYYEVVTSYVVIYRVAGGYFDQSIFDATSFNRGWITIEYV